MIMNSVISGFYMDILLDSPHIAIRGDAGFQGLALAVEATRIAQSARAAQAHLQLPALVGVQQRQRIQRPRQGLAHLAEAVLRIPGQSPAPGHRHRFATVGDPGPLRTEPESQRVGIAPRQIVDATFNPQVDAFQCRRQSFRHALPGHPE